MKVCYYYSTHFPEAIEVLPANTQFFNTTGDSLAYWSWFRSNWDGQDDLMVIEQDIIIREDVLSGFENCESQWCVYPYGTLTQSLGCVRFRKEIQLAVLPFTMPHSLIFVGEYICTRDISCNICTEFAVCWQHLDLRVAGALKERGYHPCIHSPDVKHLH